MRTDSIKKSIVYSQICLHGSILLCVWLLPAGVFTNDGISYYGAQRSTVIPHILGLLTTAFFIYRAAHGFYKRNSKAIATGLVCIAVMLVGVAATPYAVNASLYMTHVFFGTTVFFTQYLLALYVSLYKRGDAINRILALIITATFWFTGYYLGARGGYLIVGQVVFQALFAIILYRYADMREE